MPLQGPDGLGLFCILLQQSLDRSTKPLDLFRPYEHGIDRNDNKPFANDIMLLTVRDRDNHGNDVLATVRKTLDPAELARIADRISNYIPSVHSSPRIVTENPFRAEGQPRPKGKRKQQQQKDGENSASGGSAKRSRQVPLKGPRMSEYNGLHSDDDVDDTPLHSKARGLASWPKQQQRMPASPSSASVPSLIQAPCPPVVNRAGFQFTDEQARRIQFVWKINYEGDEAEFRHSLSVYSTFRTLLDGFRENTDYIPSAAQQIQAKLWLMRYKLADGRGKAVFVKPASLDFEHSFDSILRHVADSEELKKDRCINFDIEVRAIDCGGE